MLEIREITMTQHGTADMRILTPMQEPEYAERVTKNLLRLEELLRNLARIASGKPVWVNAASVADSLLAIAEIDDPGQFLTLSDITDQEDA